jgi:DNA-directed RNA polymerase subunit RPC12/RpoP
MGIPILSEIERIINEHGSAVILKERLALANDQFSLLNKEKPIAERQVLNLEAEKLVYLRENEALRLDLSQAEEKIRNLEKQLAKFVHENPDGYACSYCGSKNIKRKGNRSNPEFCDLGVIDHVFLCNECGKESAFMQIPK